MPIIIDHCRAISISDLRHRGWLKPDQIRSGTLTWRVDDDEIGSVYAAINTYSESPTIELAYFYNGREIKYKVQLVSAPSNLGKGKVWYFQCPETGRLCRKLYGAGEKFLHREAFHDCLYYIQTKSRKQREMKKLYDQLRGQGKYRDEYGEKHFRAI